MDEIARAVTDSGTCVLVMVYIVGGPVSGVMSAMTDFLNNMGTSNAILLGVILGAMMCFDLGGPVNKAAYTFGVGLLASQTYAPMAAIMQQQPQACLFLVQQLLKKSKPKLK